ncbi:hypothetical protein PR048_015404 [Dryococelus australis]|uniref:Uncharacterized protein n=1 Tax=Dryococelus australis TaxID=614101 RepID=A0ABQ9HGU9_9NEOP|nr:hypothetical protein PR048_015404 [Dryococelus australis]
MLQKNHGGLPLETETVVNLCTNVTTKEKLKEQIRPTMQKSNNEVDCLQILLALNLTNYKFVDAALQSAWAPTNSVDAEIFFSKYIIIVHSYNFALQSL